MKRNLSFALFGAMVIVQLAVPISMIMGQERILASGHPYKFRCMPVDPYDAFRGKYVSLSFSEQSAPIQPGAEFLPEQSAYASLSEDSEGFAHIRLVSPTPPEDGDYLRVRITYVQDGTAYFGLPFDRYYMNEYDAPAAESAYQAHTAVGEADAYAVVRVRNGAGVIERLMVGGEPIEDFIRRVPAS